VIRDAFNRIKRPFTPERKFALMAIMCNYLEAYGSEFSLDIYQYMSTYIKMGLEGIIQAEYIFYLCQVLRYLCNHAFDVGQKLLDYQALVDDYDPMNPITEIFQIFIGLSNSVDFDKTYPELKDKVVEKVSSNMDLEMEFSLLIQAGYVIMKDKNQKMNLKFFKEVFKITE